MKNKKLRKQYTAQFYHKNRIAFSAALLMTLCTISLNFGITWVMQQMLDAVSGVPEALSLSVLGLLTAGIVLLIILFKLITYWSKPRFMQRAMLQYKNFAFQKLTKKSVRLSAREYLRVPVRLLQ